MTGLTGRERLLRALHQQPVDRIPVAPFIHVNYVKEFFGSHDIDWVERTPEVYRHYGFDLVHRNCSAVPDAFGPEGPNWEIEVATEEIGRDQNTTTIIHTPGGDLRCVESLRWTYEYDAEISVTEYPIKTEHDLDLVMEYQPAPGAVDVSDARRAVDIVGDEGVTAPWIQGAFNVIAVYYRRLDDLLVDAVLNPTFYGRMMAYFVGRYRAFVQQVIDAGIDFVSYGSNIANGKLVSPSFYREHILPYEVEFIDFIQRQGVGVIHHNCGYARNLLPLYATMGMCCHESLTPPPYGDTTLAEAVDAFAGGGTTLSGNIDQLDLVRKGSASEIEAAVKATMDTVRGRCHFILATTDYFNENTPADRIQVLADAGRKYGRL
ncbi:MAG: hypothetical protein GX620_09720 [Chloroflexi bacterium]|nr:hypothetical protein [Chloroflexota bacterium]